ncbi:hypothetical protein V5O48_000437 [Marasmius crinis-equi]|uniref:Uncharacterized protein n=1 Tax=Marasmius crinis-equi TaxID=585013 RepID=A0ABR3G1E4_9AGAR
MTTLVDMQSSVPTENWDEDFEFHASPNNDKRVPIPSHPTRASTTSTAFTEDWDRDTDAAPLHESRPSDMNATQFQQEKENLHLANWAEAGPSTPTKPHFPSSTENWDDDFEDRLGDSPARKPRPININSKKPHPSSPSRSQFEQESWDEEFDLASPTTSPKTKLFTNTNDHNTPDDDNMHDDEDEDDMDFNFQDKDEEDRTVTARSRRGALARLTTSHLPHANTTPPPPVPPIPASLLTTDISSVGLHFPRSPTGSVFSAPSVNSGRDSVAYSYYHNNSTTHLRPTVSRQSGGGFANLPPSPPIHKERERRRLRKKSRPDPSGQDDSLRQPLPQSVNASTESIGLRPRPVTPQTPPRSSSPQLPSSAEPSSTPSTSNGNRNSIQPGSSPPTKTPLLSRIGSVKKWGVRKKRASSTPSELMLQEDSQDSSTHMNGSDPSTSRSPSKSGNWFFRVTSGGGPAEIGRKSSSAPAVDESEEDAEASKSAYTPKARKVATASNLETNPDTASKLVKRKSSGFMPLRRNKGPMNDNSVMYEAGELPSDLEHELGLDSDVALGRSPSKRKKQSTAQPTARPTAGSSRQPSYGGLGLGRAGKGFESSSDDLTEKEPMRSRARSFSRSKHKEPALDEKEGQRSFMGSVRRISLVGIHKRTKSGVSLVEGAGKGPSSSHRKQSEGDDPMDVDSESHPSSRTPSRSSGLLPPIELQPPSPPRTVVDRSTGKTARAASPNNLDTLLHASNAPSTSSPSLVLKPTGSPQAASLGRSTVVPAIVGSSAILRDSNVPRRNSLGDLKIPARISQAQVGLRRDLGMVREFASNVEQLKELQATYNALLMEVQGVLDAYAQQASSRATSPNFFGLPLSRPRSNAQGPGQPPQQAYKQLAAAFYTINSKYRIAWECAELLIELGTGSTGASPPSTSVSVPTMATTFSSKNRERAITLSGEESKPPTPVPGQVSSSQSAGPPIASPPSMSWRASTGRHDLSQRQLLLLREMLNNPDTSQVIDPQQLPTPDESSPVNRDWRWGEGMNSTVTLPSEESSAQGGSHNGDAPAKKRRTSKLVGMSGFRDMLRALKRSQVEAPALPASSTSLSTESSSVESSGQRYAGKVPTYGRRRAKTSSGPELDRSRSPYGASVSLSAKQSPRRPSLASIFRIGGKSKQTTPSSTHNASTVDLSVENLHEQRRQKDNGSSGGDDDDWDHVSDLDHGAGGARTREATATIRGRSPYLQDLQLPSSQIPSRPQTPKSRSNSASHSQTSLQWEGLPPPSVGIPSRTNRLSNVEETVEDSRTPHRAAAAARKAAASPSRPPSRSKNVSKTGSVRSMPPQPLGGLPDVKLAMTPENIKPLLENSKEVHNRLTECIAEIRQLLPVE